MKKTQTILTVPEAVALLLKGEVIAYPTEAVYGLGCCPHLLPAVEQILLIKERPWEKGLILIAAQASQFAAYADFSQLDERARSNMMASWPGPNTWVVPAKPEVSKLLRGTHPTIALRVSAHPVVRALCEKVGGPLVSTSANRAYESPAVTLQELEGLEISGVVEGALGGLSQPTQIRDAMTGALLRE